jgi:hypothetical protein
MKPCSRNRKPIAWLALGVLDSREAEALRDHLALCEGCRRYWEEMSNLTEGLAAAGPDSDLLASEFFHRRVAGKLRAVESVSIVENPGVWFRGLMPLWRVALPAVAVLMIAFFAMVAAWHHPALSEQTPPAQPVVQVAPAPSPESDLAPTVANYEAAANQSVEKLLDLLTRQGNQSLPPVPAYTALGLESTNTPF